MCNQILNKILHVHFQVWKVRLFDTWCLWGASRLFPLSQRYLRCEVWVTGRREVITQAGSMEWNSSLLLIGGSKSKRQTFKHSLQIKKFTVLFILVFIFLWEWLCIVHKGQSHCCVSMLHCTNLYFSLNQSVIISIREFICGWVLLNMSRWRSSQRHAATLTPSRD